MRSLWKRLPPLHPRAREMAIAGLRIAVLLLSCAVLLLWFGNPANTYIARNAAAIQDVARSVLLLTVIGTLWMQSLYGSKDKKDKG